MVAANIISTTAGYIEISAFDFPYLKFLLLIWLIYIIVFFVSSLFISNKKNIIIHAIIGVGLISLGFVTGIIMGNNRNPISDTIMSSVFTLIGGVVVYMFAQKNTDDGSKFSKSVAMLTNNENRLLVALVLILFPVSLLYGSHIGAEFRLEDETYNNNVSYNRQLGLDSLEIWTKSSEATIEKNKTNKINYYNQMYKTWSDNEEKRYEKQLNSLKKGDSIPDVPNYVSSK